MIKITGQVNSMKKSILIIIILLLFQTIVRGQDKQLYSGNYYNSYFIDFASDLEKNYDIKLYFNSNLDSVQLDHEFTNLNLDELINIIALKTGINFLLKDDNVVIATDNYLVLTELSPAFFERGLMLENTVRSSQKSILETIREKAEEDKEVISENKIVDIGDVSKRLNGNTAIISGYVREVKTGEGVIGATVYKKNPTIGVATDQFGYFSLTLPKGEHDLFITSLGMKPAKRKINLYSDGELNVELRNDLISLKEIVITGESNAVESLQTGFANINVKNISQLPSMMGEADIMKIALTLPGVQTVGEGAAGFNVRGGSADQNLVLLNDVPVYNTSHLFGFVSVFNPDVLSGADLYKSGISSNYGGRISSVFDVSIKDGNKKKFGLKGGISPITTKITLEGPIKRDSSSFIVGIRTTYSDWIFTVLNDPALRNSSASFFDVVAKVNNSIDDKNDLIASAYYSKDNFRLNSDSLYRYSSSNASLQWRHSISNKLYANTSFSFANYNYQLSSESNPVNAFVMDYNINHFSAKTEFNYFTKSNVNIRFGLTSTLYQLEPGKKNPLGEESLVVPIILPNEKGLESALYVGTDFKINTNLSIYGGIRLSMFNSMGPGYEYHYLPDNPKEIEFISDTVYYANNELIKTYVGPELRFSARYKFREDLSLKVSYDRMNQYIHILSNTASISPVDSWRLSNGSIKPQRGDQYSLGLYKTFLGTSLEMSVETYYKSVNNVLEYKDGASLVLNEALETDIINGKGRSYGAEFLVKKNSGKLTGWLSYTYSRSLIQANGLYTVEQINSGNYYPSNYDKPHALILVSNYKVNRRINFSINVNYSTGRPITYPLSKYRIKGQSLLLYSDRNQYRIPDNMRVDVSFNFDGNHKVHKKIHSSWSLSVYNLFSRANAYSVFFKSENSQINGYKLSVFKQAIPTITYHFRLK
jgi:hypothetical protein